MKLTEEQFAALRGWIESSGILAATKEKADRDLFRRAEEYAHRLLVGEPQGVEEGEAPSSVPLDDLPEADLRMIEACLRDCSPGPWQTHTFLVVGGKAGDEIAHYGLSTNLGPPRAPETAANALLAELGRNKLGALIAEIRRRRKEEKARG